MNNLPHIRYWRRDDTVPPIQWPNHTLAQNELPLPLRRAGVADVLRAADERVLAMRDAALRLPV